MRVGAVWFETPVLVRGFEANFTIFVSNSNTGQDGLAFIIQNSALGAAACE
jgi:hypothetical protein